MPRATKMRQLYYSTFATRKMKKNNTHYKRPNGSGTVVKLNGKRRKPYMAKVTTGYDELTGNQIQEPIGYFETRQEALNALSIYNMSRETDFNGVLDVIGGNTYKTVMGYKNRKLPTFSAIYGEVKRNYISTLSHSRQNAYNTAFKRLAMVHDKPINTISLFDLQACIDESKKEVGQKILSDMKTICCKVFEFAVIHQYIGRDNDYTAYIDVKPLTKANTPPMHKPISMADILTIRSKKEMIYKVIMVYILTGCRPNELIGLSKKALHLDEPSNDDGNDHTISYIITGSKTESGRNRTIPIHDTIKPYITQVVAYLRNKTVSIYRNEFTQAMEELDLNYLPYDTRHTFATLAKLYKVDEFARKRIMGHKGGNITDDIYTHAIKNRLYIEVQKIKI